MYQNYGLFINGKWRPAQDGGTAPVYSPVSETPLGDAPSATRADTEEAVHAASRAMSEWREKTAFARADTLHAVADEMTRRAEEAVRVISAETGKPLAQSRREWEILSIDQFRWYAEEARRIHGQTIESRAPGGRIEVSLEPVGVCAAFTAWNFPAVLPARKIAPALAAGCAIVLRPSSQTPGSAMILIDCIRAAGVPDGLVNLVVGATDATYTPLMESPVVRKVSLTGSTRVGQQMLRDAAATVKKASMELGGNAPLIVFEDADLETALNTTAAAKFANAGQVCVAPDRLYVHESLHDDFVAGLVARAKALKLGDGMDESVQMGPLIKARRLEETESVVADALAAGAKVRCGGGRASGFNAGHFFEPTVISDAPDSARVLAEENFSPIAAVTPFADAEDAYRRANDSDVGLAAYAFTRSPGRAREVVEALHSGMVGVNSAALACAEAPFGGTKFSGMGREGGREALLDHMETKLAQVAF
ncbi:MAG: NAD-dependent succinate-semialdehyde dehydrogenase [Alphaproteobacteria bacterium]|nr:NAD-dependent succinate-semialdehyde dehydrogenase [Alphaproteobacteria bacterium]MDA7987207.1 NAD-dependent succinate-semialdehyde dehydrogenase [Alphaproteobacteria bacterium]